jgi:hypothetical protein
VRRHSEWFNLKSSIKANLIHNSNEIITRLSFNSSIKVFIGSNFTQALLRISSNLRSIQLSFKHIIFTRYIYFFNTIS